MKATSLDGIIERVAKENGYLLKDDLQMVLITIMNQIAEDQQAGVVAALESYKEVHSDIALRWQTNAAKAANKILNAALDAGRAEMAKGMTAGAAQVVRIVNEAMDAVLTKQRAEGNRLIRELKVTAYLTMAGSLALMIGAVIMTYYSERHRSYTRAYFTESASK